LLGAFLSRHNLQSVVVCCRKLCEAMISSSSITRKRAKKCLVPLLYMQYFLPVFLLIVSNEFTVRVVNIIIIV
jgi:hypothetical protein